ncbi:lantibiotic dehydratase [Mucilaginibacter ginkgonis]|uniref:Lantibiotic dehydratase n=1 Tax=Mucilaginibacter ginkgonis TaxID=2682091 RepID=A0A6I4HWR6_9SPHI|nr:lantibiotic dehydratase [Mucilaginibacter ginkgonis]QQL49976.1 lantibiotic dehydratase [Mucilaginibacter ginkgonis]
MPDYIFAKHAILRRPLHVGISPLDLEYFLNSPIFKAAVYIATPDYYYLLESNNFEAANLNRKSLNTLKKYINRFCYRPVPFGLFASVSYVQWQDNINQFKTTDQNAYAFIAFSQQLINTIYKYHNHNFDPSIKYFLNFTVYKNDNEYRYIKTSLSGKNDVRNYKLQSIAYSKPLARLVNFGTEPKAIEEMVKAVVAEADCSQKDALDYIIFLAEEQFLISELEINITGKDQFTKPHSIAAINRLEEVLPRKIPLSLVTTDYFENLCFHIKRQIVEPALLPKDLFNVIAISDGEETNLSAKIQQKINAGLQALSKLGSYSSVPMMDKFIKQFEEKFDQQTVPLLLAVDPENGIDYDFSPETESNILLETLKIGDTQRMNPGGSWTLKQSMLLRKWHEQLGHETNEILLNENDIQDLDGPQPGEICGSVFFRMSDTLIYIENAGGINPASLIGRFTVADEKIRDAAMEMANYIEELNPEIVYAEILHLSDPKVDNINRRENFYRYDLPITAKSVRKADCQLRLIDLSLKLIHGKLYLWSARLRKIVIPMLSSAYNHSRDKLPLFRFLVDLGYQYSNINLSLDMPGLFPGLASYPRVSYNGVVLSLAKWSFSSAIFQKINDPDPQNRYSDFLHIAKKNHFPVCFSLKENDQQLVFNSKSFNDIMLFLDCISNKKNILIEEFLTDTSCQNTDEKKINNTFVNQFNCFLLPKNPYPVPKFNLAKVRNGLRHFIPGSEWLYLKLYCAKLGTNKLLLDIAPLLFKTYDNGKILQWFFIRYEDHAPHIRLRLKIDPRDLPQIMNALKSKLSRKIDRHIVREYTISTYSRELERYAPAGIHFTENFFTASSNYVLAFLKASKRYHFLPYLYAISGMVDILKQLIKGKKDQMAFLYEVFKNFEAEFKEPGIKVQLDKKFRELRPEIIAHLSNNAYLNPSQLYTARKLFLQSIMQIEGKLSGSNTSRNDYIASIIHMHLNRIFNTEPRKQEMICFYLLYKHLKSEFAKID